MADRTEPKRLMTRYLLGHMSEEERADFEKQYLGNEELFEELVATETETIRSYLAGGGSEEERKEVERRFFATPSRRGHVEFEKTLKEYISQHVPAPAVARQESKKAEQYRSHTPFWRLAAVAALLVILIGGPWLMLINRRLSREIQHLRQEQAQHRQQEQQLRQQVAELDTQLEQQRKLTSYQQELIANLQSPAIAPFTLSRGLIRRVDQQRTLVLPRSLALLPLHLRLERDEYARYSVSLETPEGERVWQQQNVVRQKSRINQPVIALKVPSQVLQNRTYIMTLTGTAADGSKEEVATYTFRIQRQ